MADEPKIIIDSDWKAQAQAEKEKLASQAKPKAAAPGEDDLPKDGEPIGFSDIVSMFATQALQYLGAFPDPRTGQAMVAPEYAKLHIDMLAILEAKTKGNLTEKEQQLITRVISELRVEFVEISKALEKAVAEGKIKPRSASGPGVVTPGGGGLTGPGGAVGMSGGISGPGL